MRLIGGFIQNGLYMPLLVALLRWTDSAELRQSVPLFFPASYPKLRDRGDHIHSPSHRRN